jgi:hypothetical protein
MNPTTGKQKWVWDRRHIITIGAFIYGASQTGIPLITAMLTHVNTNPGMVILGLIVLIGSAVGAFFDNPPNSVEAAVDAGKIAVTDAPQILAKRASLRPPPMMTFPKGEPTLIEQDPDKTKPF